MTIIPKKRKFESSGADIPEVMDYGQKYHCDYCQKDISHLVRISCHKCKDFDLCVECFCSGVEIKEHKRTHAYRVMDILDFPIFQETWGADEELLLNEGLEIFGMGNWEQIADHIGTKNRLECFQHYAECYIQSPTWPIPDMSKTFTGRRSQAGKFSIKSKPIPKAPRPPASAPSNHEIAGFMPGRMEFETEFDNDAEHLVKDMVFEENEDEGDVALKVAVLDIYNTALERRAERKKFIFNTDCLDFKRIQTMEKRRSPEEKELFKRIRALAKLQTPFDFQELSAGFLNEIRLRQRITQLQDYRKMGITSFREAAEYDREKQNRAQNRQSMGYDRFTQRPRQPRLSGFFGDEFATPGFSRSSTPTRTTSNPTSNFVTPMEHTGRKQAQPLDIRGTDAYDLLLPAEQNLCSTLRILPRAYLVIKETMLSEYEKRNGKLRKKEARALVKIDVNKSSKIFDFFSEMGWLNSGLNQ